MALTAAPVRERAMRGDTARRIRTTAALLDDDHPEMVTGGHLRDAATVLDHGSTDGAKRHLDAAMELLTPRNLIRHGITDDEGHALAKHHMHLINRHRLAVQDIEDQRTRNEQADAARRERQQSASPPGTPVQAQAQPPPGKAAVGLAAEPARTYRYRHGWIKIDGAAGLHGKQVVGTDAHGGTFLGTYQHPGRVIPRHSGALKAKYVREATTVDQAVFGREQARQHAHRRSVLRRIGFGSHDLAGRPGSVIDLRSSTAWLHEPRGRGGEWITGPSAPPGSVSSPFGSHPSRADATAFAQMFGSVKAPSLADQAKHAGLSPAQSKVYLKLRKRGRSHEGALLIAEGFRPEMLGAMFANSSQLAILLTGPKGYKHGWIKADDAGRIHGMVVHGKVTPAQPLGYVTGRYNSLNHTVAPRQGRPVRVSHVTTADSAIPPPVRRKAMMARLGIGSGLAGDSPAVLLAFHPDQARDYRGRWVHIGGSRLRIPRPPGSFQHARAMDDYADTLDVADARIAVHKATKAMIGRDIPTAHRHMRGAIWQDSAFGGGLHRADLEALDAALDTVPKTAAVRNRPRNPLMDIVRAYHGLEPRGSPGSEGRSSLHYKPPVLSEFSARTALLERTPAPRGKPGGPGLYDVKGLGHTAYMQQIVKALIEKRGMPPGRAYAIARGAIRKWMRGGGHVHPEVRAAAGRAEAGEIARQARAHTHAIEGWEIAGCLIELAAQQQPTGSGGGRPQSSNWKNEQRVAKGQAGGGRFGTGGGQAKGKGQQHGRAARRAALTRQIAGIRSQIAALRAQLPQTSGKSRSSTPAKKGAAATSAKQAAQGKATATKAGTAPRKTMSPATIHAKIAALRATLQADIAQLRSL